MRYHIFNIGRPYTNDWWARNRELAVITAGYEGASGDRGDVILHDMAQGDWVFAYANGHGFVGAGLVGSAESYRLAKDRDLPIGYESDHRHLRSVTWIYYVTEITGAVSLANVGRQAPRRTKEEIRDTSIADRLLGLLKEKLAPPQRWYPEELASGETYLEGSVERIVVDRYERNPEARRKCIEHWGAKCAVCSFDFGMVYGALGDGFIHVHHLRSISGIGAEYEVDPITDLRPVCPNCHSMLHRSWPPLGIEVLRTFIDAAK